MSITLAVTSREPHTARESGILKEEKRSYNITSLEIAMPFTRRELHTPKETGPLKTSSSYTDKCLAVTWVKEKQIRVSGTLKYKKTTC